MSNQTLVGIFIAASLAFTGCGPKAAGGSNSGGVGREPLVCDNGVVSVDGSNGIVGGSAVAKDSWLGQTVVLLVMKMKMTDKNGKSQYAYGKCTASLLDYNIVLTAAHCVADERTDSETVAVTEIRAFFSAQPACNADKSIDLSSGIPVQQNEIHIHPAYKGIEDGMELTSENEAGDLAMLKLQWNAPGNWRTVKLSDRQVDLSGAEMLLAAGYGRTNPEINDFEPYELVLRRTYLRGLLPSTAAAETAAWKARMQEYIKAQGSSAKPEVVQQIEKFLPKPTFYEMGAERDFLYVDQSQGVGICRGDSGGAAFHQRNGKYYVVGIASWGQNSVNNAGLCASVGAYTNTFRYKNWLTQKFNQLKNPYSPVKNIFE